MIISDDEFSQLTRDCLEYLTPEQLADDLGVPASTVNRWAEGKNLPYRGARSPAFKIMQQHEIWDDL